MMTDDQRSEFRRRLGVAIIELQNRYRGFGPDVVIPELIAALVSLAAYLSHDNACLLREQFEQLCTETMRHEWNEPEHSTMQ